MEEELLIHYNNIITGAKTKAATLQRQIHLMGSIRLAIVIAAIVLIFLYRASDAWILGLIVLAAAIPFVILMIRHNKLDWKKSYAEAESLSAQQELDALDYKFSAFDGANELISSLHPFTTDLDIFGEHSLFQSLNRTVTKRGKEVLADWFINPLLQKEKIILRQKAIRELSELDELRRNFYVTGILRKDALTDSQQTRTLTKIPISFSKSLFWKAMIWLIPAIWILLFLAASFSYIPWSIVGLFFAVAFLFAYAQGGKIAKLHEQVNKLEKILKTYSSLMEIVEDRTFQSEELSTITKSLNGNDIKASNTIAQLSRFIGALDQRFSLAGILLNIFYMRDTWTAIRLEHWLNQHSNDTEKWFDSLAKFDAYSSLATFAYNHPDYIYPEIADQYFCLKGTALGHPLLDRKICVKNDIDISHDASFLIITGANMAGKSTFLRTVGVNYLLSEIGAPVCAKNLTIFPAPIITSLRTNDSLAGNESYFFAELKRLKMIIDRLKSGEKLFIILDEILKGTNSVDKQKGSIALMRQLVNYHSCGIIATHDLALSKLADEFPKEIRNFRFEADIIDNHLTFSYRLREGIAVNMNACFLMNSMGITV